MERMNFVSTMDGCRLSTRSLADCLVERGILSLPDKEGEEMICERFFDDWYLYEIKDEKETVYSLYKMREQEYEKEEGIQADGDTPGMTVSFIAFDAACLMRCLEEPSHANRLALNEEIDRVVVRRGQRHHKLLKAYFSDVKAEAPYLMAELYVKHVAGFSENGVLPVSKHYASLYEKSKAGKASAKDLRLPTFIEENNRKAGRIVCDHKTIRMADPNHLTEEEKLAILATHTANTSYHSFAAEVRFHAVFLVDVARIPLPFIGHSVYDSAIRADMTIEDGELVGPTPYYQEDSKWMREQKKFHTAE